MVTPKITPGRTLPCNTARQPIIPIRSPTIIGPRVSPTLPPVPCNEIANPLVDTISLDSEEIADGCQNVIDMLYRDAAITANQNVVADPRARANIDRVIMEVPSIPPRYDTNLSPR